MAFRAGTAFVSGSRRRKKVTARGGEAGARHTQARDTIQSGKLPFRWQVVTYFCHLASASGTVSVALGFPPNPAKVSVFHARSQRETLGRNQAFKLKQCKTK